ncbi:MAG TPA: hypothetical protein VF148_10585 [Acidimicrobiia bacterium]
MSELFLLGGKSHLFLADRGRGGGAGNGRSGGRRIGRRRRRGGLFCRYVIVELLLQGRNILTESGYIVFERRIGASQGAKRTKRASANVQRMRPTIVGIDSARTHQG